MKNKEQDVDTVSTSKFFSEYRHKDYRTPRSMREAYGYEPVLYEERRVRMVGGEDFMDITLPFVLLWFFAVVVVACLVLVIFF